MFKCPPSPPQPSPKKKTPSQLHRQEHWREEAQSKAAEVFPDHEPLVESVVQPKDFDKDDATIGTKTVSTEAAEKSASSDIQFSCYQCSYESVSDKGVRQHIRMKHIIYQLDKQDGCKVNKSDSVKNLFPLCPEWSGYCG